MKNSEFPNVGDLITFKEDFLLSLNLTNPYQIVQGIYLVLEIELKTFCSKTYAELKLDRSPWNGNGQYCYIGVSVEQIIRLDERNNNYFYVGEGQQELCQEENNDQFKSRNDLENRGK